MLDILSANLFGNYLHNAAFIFRQIIGNQNNLHFIAEEMAYTSCSLFTLKPFAPSLNAIILLNNINTCSQ